MSTKDLLVCDVQKVREKWGKTEADVKRDVEILKDWLKSQKHLPEIPSDNMIEFILTNCKYSIERTKPHLDMYYTVRTVMPEIFDQNHPSQPDHQAIYELMDYVVLPKLTKSLCRVTVIKFKEGSADKLDLLNMLTYGTNIYEVRVNEDLVMGEVFIIDCQYFNLSHIVKFTPSVLKKYMLVSEKVWGSRMKEVHLINYPNSIDTLMSVAKGLLQKKLYDRIFLHSSYDSLLEKIPRDMLPSDYGGQEKSLKELIDLWKLKFEEYNERFDKLLKLRVDEKLRPVALSNSEVLGYYGNFKKLDVD
ncbi:unnamed protein product [Psylliodes chrysocephalus]|uniref:CRAL-TRIO domain-containing protein n=1 Tax=Psylliodes chrysocephalus TaxID=3402493 RepID=A0A9P0D0X1_9CUCU|nr:unnamed protein product [Psylliodes chrysocephala]